MVTMQANQLADKRAIVVGGSRGLGRGVVEAFLGAGATVVALARDVSPLAALALEDQRLNLVAADASDPVVAGRLLGGASPDIVALVAGAAPVLRPLHQQTWETFSTNWHVDVRLTFSWLREALLLPLKPGSHVIVMSSGAALFGSPLSGGYAGAKATQRFLAEYAAQESARHELGIRIHAVLPRLTPATELGRPAVAAYAARQGIDEETYLRRLGKPITPEIAGTAFLQLAIGAVDGNATAYGLTADGLQPISDQKPVPTTA
jgi:NAD(P)-dependent dehydrogenase (short-subunit alcohol dehydrogenase family)